MRAALQKEPVVFGVRIVAFLALLLVACWRPADRLTPTIATVLALCFLASLRRLSEPCLDSDAWGAAVLTRFSGTSD